MGYFFPTFFLLFPDFEIQEKAAKDRKRQEKEQKRTRERKNRGPMGRPVAAVGGP